MRGYVRKRGKSSWTIEASAGFDPLTGKRRRFTETVRGTKRDAEAALRSLLQRIETGTEIDPSALTVAEFFARWLDHSRSRVRPRTWERYESLARLHIVPAVGSLRLGKVRPVHLQACLDEMAQKGASPRSVLHCYRVAHSALRQAQRWQLIASNPAEAVQPPRPSRPQLVIPDVESLHRILQEAEGSRFGPPLTVAVGTGLRRGELLGLRWRDVDLTTGRLQVRSSLQRIKAESGLRLVLVEPKTDRARRQIALPAFVVDALKRLRVEQAQRRLLLGEAWQDLDAVFERGDGYWLNPEDLTRVVGTLGARVGLAGVRLHDLRHGYASALLARGVHPKVASEALGHSSVAFTLDTYSHVVPSLQEAAARAMDEALAEAAAVKLPSTGGKD